MVRYSLLFLIIALVVSSCSVERQVRKAKRVAYENPKEFAEFCSVFYPVIPTYIQGKDSIIERTVTVQGDSIPCPPNKPTVTYVKCPDTKVIYRDVLRVDTITKENTAKSSDLSNKLASQGEELRETKQRLEEKDKLADNRLFIIIALGLLLAGAVYFIFIK